MSPYRHSFICVFASSPKPPSSSSPTMTPTPTSATPMSATPQTPPLVSREAKQFERNSAKKRVLDVFLAGQDWLGVAASNAVSVTTARRIATKGSSEQQPRGGVRTACQDDGRGHVQAGGVPRRAGGHDYGRHKGPTAERLVGGREHHLHPPRASRHVVHGQGTSNREGRHEQCCEQGEASGVREGVERARGGWRHDRLPRRNQLQHLPVTQPRLGSCRRARRRCPSGVKRQESSRSMRCITKQRASLTAYAPIHMEENARFVADLFVAALNSDEYKECCMGKKVVVVTDNAPAAVRSKRWPASSLSLMAS
jgi:hypothetical protein